MIPAPATFQQNAEAALADGRLQAALATLPGGLVAQRRSAVARLPEFEALRDQARDIKDHALDNLATYLEAFEGQAKRAGTQVHWAGDAADARRIVQDICRAAGARLVVKGKSMVTEEISLNAHLAENGIEVIESDLGEYITQQRGEAPSHIIAPAIHLTHLQNR